MNAAAAATPSSPQKTSTGMEHHVKTVKQITGSSRPKCISPSSQPTGAGEPSASVCVGCDRHLSPQETYACDTCAAGWMKDANFNMCGGEGNG